MSLDAALSKMEQFDENKVKLDEIDCAKGAFPLSISLIFLSRLGFFQRMQMCESTKERTNRRR